MLTKEEFLRNVDELYAGCLRAEAPSTLEFSPLPREYILIEDKANTGGTEDNFPFRNFPFVKCKVLPYSRRIYYVPSDNDYTGTQIIPGNGDIFCRTVHEAQAAGFQHP